MSIKSKVFAATAALTLIGAAGALSAGTASAATPSCGAGCISLFPREYSGTTLGAPQFVLDVLRQGDKAGQPVILFRASNSDPAEDFTISDEGTVHDFFTAGLVSAAVALHYGGGAGAHPHGTNDEAYEIEYSPYGVDSGLCAGVAGTAAAGSKVTLQSCGVTGKTVWIEDTVNSPVVPYYPAINGSDTNFSDPFVLTYPSASYPTDMPRAQLYVANLGGFQGGVTDNDNQLWTGVEEILP